MRRVERLIAALLFVAAGAAFAQDPLARWWRAAELLLALSASHGEGAAPERGEELIEEEVAVPGRSGPIRARLYRLAARERGPGLVVSHGVHYQGIDERRLVPFARELARAGLTVLTPELDDLTDYRITRRGLDVITDSALWLGAQRAIVSSPQVGLLGFSFAGGLSLVAASRPELHARLGYVTSVGGHHDLSRVLGFLLTNRIETPEGVKRTEAHEYGLIVLLYQNLDAFVPEPDRALMRASVRAWLMEQRARSTLIASGRKTLESEQLFDRIQRGRLQELAPALGRLIDARPAELAELSPRGRLAEIAVPVYLLHGTGDSVIPPSETEWASRELAGREHKALVSPLLEHVEVSQTAGVMHQVALVDFMAKML